MLKNPERDCCVFAFFLDESTEDVARFDMIGGPVRREDGGVESLLLNAIVLLVIRRIVVDMEKRRAEAIVIVIAHNS